MAFRDRTEAGQRLAAELMRRGLHDSDVVVLGLPRGGVPVAFEVAAALGAPLDVIVVRKIGVPYQPELAMGAIGEDGVEVVDPAVLRAAGVSTEEVAVLAGRERRELDRRVEHYVGARARQPLDGRTAVVVDDGIATGATARAACLVARARGAARVVLAVPVAPGSSLSALRDAADEVVCLETPEPFFAVGQFYLNFAQTSDSEVTNLLHRASAATAGTPVGAGDDPAAVAADDPPVREEDVEVGAGPVSVPGRLCLPDEPVGVVVFAHGSGSSRFSPRNRAVADAFNQVGLATLLFDLLTPDEELDREMVFDIGLLAQRLAGAVDWVRRQAATAGLPVGVFGASTGGGAALWAAAEPGSAIAAVVSRGGRPDLAGRRLDDVRVPTLLIVGGADDVVLRLNRDAQARLGAGCHLTVVPGATHLFEEPGALEEVARLAADWFLQYLPRSAEAGTPASR